MDTNGVTRVIRRRSYGWLLVSVLLVYGVISLLLAFANNPIISWPDVRSYLFSPLILGGVVNTLWITAASLTIGAVIGTILALMRLSPHAVPRAIAWTYIWIFRGIPTLVQIIFWFNLGLIFPTVGLSLPFVDYSIYSVDTNSIMSAMFCALLGLGLNEAAYVTEIVRGGILAVDPGQREAAKALGMTPLQTMRHAVLPQAGKIVIPPMGNELIAMLKQTSLVSVIGYAELLSTARRIYAVNYKTVELLIVVSIWYLALTSILSLLQGYLERRMSYQAKSRPGKVEVKAIQVEVKA